MVSVDGYARVRHSQYSRLLAAYTGFGRMAFAVLFLPSVPSAGRVRFRPVNIITLRGPIDIDRRRRRRWRTSGLGGEKKKWETIPMQRKMTVVDRRKGEKKRWKKVKKKNADGVSQTWPQITTNAPIYFVTCAAIAMTIFFRYRRLRITVTFMCSDETYFKFLPLRTNVHSDTSFPAVQVFRGIKFLRECHKSSDWKKILFIVGHLSAKIIKVFKTLIIDWVFKPSHYSQTYLIGYVNVKS